VLTQAKANARITVQTIAALSQHGQVFQSVVHDRVDYAASMTKPGRMPFKTIATASDLPATSPISKNGSYPT